MRWAVMFPGRSYPVNRGHFSVSTTVLRDALRKA